MTRLLAALPVRPADPDRELLGRWAAARDEAAFAELLRRHGPLVWGVCRRQLANPADAEDAFQAAFLVLARRADAVTGCVGRFLHRVAVLTCRNVRRANRRRPASSLPSDIPVTPPTDRVLVDDLLDRLPERDRRAVVLCHLLGLTRTEAATELGIPEGTLSARLSRGLAKLRGKEAALTLATVPTALLTATARAVGVYDIAATGLSPIAAGAATGVIRMFWVKRLTAVAAVIVAGLATVGVGVSAGHRPAVAADPAAKPDGLPADWTGSAELEWAGDKAAVKVTARVEMGWVVARCDAPAGFKVWEVVLAQANNPTPPHLVADRAAGGLTVEYGRYFVRDNGTSQLRVLRQRKTADAPAWPVVRPDEDTHAGAQTTSLHLRSGKQWLWATAGPFGNDIDRPDAARADVCLRLDHLNRDGGRAGSGRVTGLAGGVNVADHGDTHATDDGELFVASYNPHLPDPPGTPAPPAKQPDTPPPGKPALPAKPTPPAVDLGKLDPDTRKAFEELVPIAVTGTVRDADGKPIPGARVHKQGTIGYMTTFGQTRFNGSAVTDADGRYTLWFRTQPDTTVVVTALEAWADGYVTHRQNFSLLDEVKAHPDKPGEWDFTLAKGELLAGTVPAAAGKEHVLLLVRGPSFERIELLENGRFKLWVPKGRYTLTAVLDMKSVPRDKKLSDTPEYARGLVLTESAVLRDVPSGRGDLVVK